MGSEHRYELRVVDAHYGGDVSRVVIGGVPFVPGDTVHAKREWLQRDGDALRRMLLGPPYGDPSMCANVIVDTDPDMPEAEAGYVIMEAMGYPHFSGSNSMCVLAALLESGYLELGPPGIRVAHLEAPSGLIRAEVRHDGRFVESVTLECDPAWVVERGLEAALPGVGAVTFDLVWSGCFYAVVDAEAQGFALTEAERPTLAEFGLELCMAASAGLDLVHPVLGDTGPLSFVAFAGPLEDVDGAVQARAATYVHPGVICRCPTGTGTAARLALLTDDGTFGPGDELRTVSPTGSTMLGRVLAVAHDGDVDRATTSVSVTGRPFTLGRLDLVVNLDDDLSAFGDDPGGADGIWRLLTGSSPEDTRRGAT